MDQRDTERQVRELRRTLRGETALITRLTSRREELRGTLAEVAANLRATAASRDGHMREARALGALPEDLAEDTGLTAGRVRQIAPRPTTPKRRPGGRGSAPAAARTARRAEVTAVIETPATEPEVEVPEDQGDADTCEVVDTPAGPVRVRGNHNMMTDTAREAIGEVVVAAQRRFAAEHPAPAPAAAPEPRRTPGRAPGRPHHPLPPLTDRPYSIGARVEQAMALCQGDMEAATFRLLDSATQDAMTLLDQCRAGARYDYTAHPSLPDPLIRRGKKLPDLIWEGRPQWRTVGTPGARVSVLDTNAAYLAAIRRVHLPIGKLERDPDGTPFDRRRSGIYLVQVPAWQNPGVPDPMGSRRETGPVWITRPTLQLLHRAYRSRGVDIPILESYTSGSSENLLTKFGDVMAAARMDAIGDRDPVTGDYVKAMYSRFVSTSGDSTANHEIFRPEWTHIIRAQAFMNLWLKGAKAAACGLTVVRMSGTDELHVVGDWRAAVVDRGGLAFPEGRALSQTKCKAVYMLGPDGREQREVMESA